MSEMTSALFLLPLFDRVRQEMKTLNVCNNCEVGNKFTLVCDSDFPWTVSIQFVFIVNVLFDNANDKTICIV